MKHKYLLLQTDPKHRKSLYNNRVKQGTAGQSPDILKHLTKQNLTKALYYAAVLLIIAGAFYFASKVNKTSNTIKLNQLELKSTQYKLQELNTQYDTVLKENAASEAEKAAQAQKVQELEAEKARLEKELQTKRNTAATTASIKATPVYAASSDHAALMSQAGISDQYYANLIINKESTWQVSVTNAGGCIGLIQACPAGLKPLMVSACPNWANDPVCQLRIAEGYMKNRYSSWSAAWQFHILNNWW